MHTCMSTILLKDSSKIWLSMAARSREEAADVGSGFEDDDVDDEETIERTIRQIAPRIHAMLLLVVLEPEAKPCCCCCRERIMSTSLEASVNVRVASTLDIRASIIVVAGEAMILAKLAS